MGSMTAIGNSIAPGVAELRVTPNRSSTTPERDELSVVDDWGTTPMPWVTVPCLPAKTFLTDMYNSSTGLLDLYL
jgi:hypothetical protein